MAFESENTLNGFAPSNYFMLFGLHMSLNSTWDHDEKKPCDDLWSPPKLQCPDDFTPQVQRCPQIPGYSCLGRLVDQSHTRTSFIHIYTCIVFMYVIYITIYIYAYISIYPSIYPFVHPSIYVATCEFPKFPRSQLFNPWRCDASGASGGSHDASAMVRCGAGWDPKHGTHCAGLVGGWWSWSIPIKIWGLNRFEWGHHGKSLLLVGLRGSVSKAI